MGTIFLVGAFGNGLTVWDSISFSNNVGALMTFDCELELVARRGVYDDVEGIFTSQSGFGWSVTNHGRKSSSPNILWFNG